MERCCICGAILNENETNVCFACQVEIGSVSEEEFYEKMGYPMNMTQYTSEWEDNKHE
jgi:hypothetical protein